MLPRDDQDANVGGTGKALQVVYVGHQRRRVDTIHALIQQYTYRVLPQTASPGWRKASSGEIHSRWIAMETLETWAEPFRLLPEQ